MGRRQLVLTRSDPSAKPRAGEAAAMTPLGALDEVLAAFGKHNTAPDGAPPKRPGAQVLYGPGMVVEASVSKGEVTQAMVSVSDDDIALPVLMRLCKGQGWRIVDLETGRAFG